MNYNEVVRNCTINIMNGNVPYVEGHAGIGKSRLPYAVAKAIRELADFEDLDIKVFTLFGSLMKEGELGGIPIPQKEKLKNVVKEFNLDEEEEEEALESLVQLYPDGTINLNSYTTHVELLRCIKHCAKPNSLAILFIDELNRCDHAVQQELMQLILENRINETVLPENCSIMAAGNPDGFDYQVLEMNDALMDRLNLYELDVDPEEWLKWAIENNIHPDVIDFITDNTSLLHKPEASDERVKPTPRSWEKLSKDLETIDEYYKEDKDKLVFNSAKSIVGTSVALSFVSFLKSQRKPMIKPNEVFECKMKDMGELIEELKSDTITRQYVQMTNLIIFLNGRIDDVKENTNNICDKFVMFLQAIPNDMMVGLMKTLNKEYEDLNAILLDNEDYTTLFFDVYHKATTSICEIQ